MVKAALKSLASSPLLTVVALTALGLWMRLHGLGSKPFWSAEVQEIFNARCSGFLDNLPDSGSDVLGFLWHNVVWRLGLEPLELWDRVPSALLGALMIPLAYAWGRELVGEGTAPGQVPSSLVAEGRSGGALAGIFAAVLACASVLLLDLSQGARWYGIASLCGNAATLALLLALRRGRFDWRALASLWGLDSVALLSHAMSITFVIVQALLACYVLCVERRHDFRSVIRLWFRLFAPIAPAVALQVIVALAFRAKMMNHQVAFLVGRPYDVWALLESAAAGLSGGWSPFWIVFSALFGAGVYALWTVRRTSAIAAGLSVLVPLVVTGVFAVLVSANAFDMTFVSFLVPAAYGAVGAALAALAAVVVPRAVGALVGLGFLGMFVFTNGTLLHTYFQSQVKPVLGADYRDAAEILSGAEPTKDDLLFYRYDEHFTHLAFYAALPLQEIQLVAEHVPFHSRGIIWEYLHRLNGCADRPRVGASQVRQLADLEADTDVVSGRAFLIVSCPPSFGDLSTEDEAGASRTAMPDYAAWVLSRGRLDYGRCERIASRLPDFSVVVLPGVLLAWRDARGESVSSLAARMRTIFASIPGVRLRLQPP